MPRPTKLLRVILSASALAALLVGGLAPLASGAAITPPTPESPGASAIDSAYVIALVVFIAIVVVVNAALIFAVARSRRRRSQSAAPRRSRRRPQFAIGAALAIGATALFVVGVVFTERAGDVKESGPDGLRASASRTVQVGISPPAAAGDNEPLTINVSGQQWIWRFGYPDGTFNYYELVVPVDTTVILELASTDVVHSWWVPALGGKFDAAPGQTNRTWFKADREGVFEGQSAAFSGAGYATMRTRVRVVSPTEYSAWLAEQADDIQAAQEAVQQQVESGSVPGLESLE